MMANGWTPERKKRQSILIRTWDPSSKSTGPRTDLGKARSSLNALKHGGRTISIKNLNVLFKKIFQVQSAIEAQAEEKSKHG